MKNALLFLLLLLSLSASAQTGASLANSDIADSLPKYDTVRASYMVYEVSPAEYMRVFVVSGFIVMEKYYSPDAPGTWCPSCPHWFWRPVEYLNRKKERLPKGFEVIKNDL